MKDTVIHNPILRGFNPDPSIVRVDNDYYIATSTFEYAPGVQIHHSTDLANWTLAARPLDRADLLDMRGNPDSGGIWAPCLTHADGLFWLIYTDVKRLSGSFKDAPNYLTTAPSIEGPWSDRVYLNSSGFDPSLFHAPDGRKWLVNMLWDHRTKGHGNQFAGIVCQEYSVEEQRLVGPIRNIFAGSDLKLTEAPHLYWRDGWYYLITAEGGTGYSHAVTMARSRDLFGPYEMHPDVHVLTTKDAPQAPLQRCGHADIVDTPEGETYMVHLCSRPLNVEGTLGHAEYRRTLPGSEVSKYRSPLGRETGIQKMRWDADGWLRLAEGGNYPQGLTTPAPGGKSVAGPVRVKEHTTFAPGALPAAFQWLRTPDPAYLFSLDAAPGRLRIFGRQSPGSKFDHALLARRQTEHRYTASTRVHYDPVDFQTFAGLICWYNTCQYHYLAICREDDGTRALRIMSALGDFPFGKVQFACDPVAVPDGPLDLRVTVTDAAQQFAWRTTDGEWQDVGPVLDASILSDEGGVGEGNNFTGAFVGMAAHDIGGRGHAADFEWFDFENEV
ncbi:glycoside hydrolase family 43 protein [Oceaniglobus trochenteri]|uniref:glycoside hydrolase family 43 protein n=1 Tax=Oceaniglobus trochenteri TaxID=2763260 RepID=UPI001CFF9AC2|nr:glycoside hydrolase family 43 protein [Oceaniglobus trochenteri]